MCKISNKFIYFVLFLLLIIGLIFFISKGEGREDYSYQTEVKKIEQFSSSTEVADIEKDLNETDFENIDKEFSEIERELQ